MAVLIEIILYIFLLNTDNLTINSKEFIINGITAVCVLIIPVINGFMRMMFTSRNLGVVNRLLIVLLWWAPILNFIILNGCCKKVRYEYFYEQSKELRNDVRKENEVCRTRYPIVMVHGIFFRDWMFINYWGRIPKELMRNGAQIFYGKQQSSNAVCKSAQELKENILKIINDTGCEKVNIIAHSKGGLDSRYAISCLGLSKYVASLTTVNTPHRGCKYVDFLLDKAPDKFKNYVAKKYNRTFVKLGDKDPDFLAGVADLTLEKCSQFNIKVKDVEGVLYQSVTSKMKNMFSSGFPLNIGYILAKIFDGENDGLVEVSSAKWGNFLGTLTAGKKGISHGDMVDLTRQDIRGYDVCEFYVDLVRKLKEKGN
ncbi:esterase/lipase family protein [Clostridium butyricum]